MQRQILFWKQNCQVNKRVKCSNVFKINEEFFVGMGIKTRFLMIVRFFWTLGRFQLSMLFQTLYNDNLPWIGSLATVEKPMTCCQGRSEVRWRMGQETIWTRWTYGLSEANVLLSKYLWHWDFSAPPQWFDAREICTPFPPLVMPLLAVYP